MGWLAPARHTFALEQTWVVWDKFFLNDLGVKGLIESLGPVFPALLEISYTLVYSMPYFWLGVLYAYRPPGARGPLAVPVRPGGAVCLRAVPLLPFRAASHGLPGPGFPDLTSRLPAASTGRCSGAYGIHTSVFPSAHVSGAFCAWLSPCSWCCRRRVGLEVPAGSGDSDRDRHGVWPLPLPGGRGRRAGDRSIGDRSGVVSGEPAAVRSCCRRAWRGDSLRRDWRGLIGLVDFWRPSGGLGLARSPWRNP